MKLANRIIIAFICIISQFQIAQFLKIGDEITVSAFSQNYIVKIDKYSMLQSTTTSGSVQVSIDGVQSESISGSVPLLSAVVFIDSGTIQSIEWDNGCWGCESTCVNNQGCPCDGSGDECNMRVYLSWIGSDSKRNRMTSGGYAKAVMKELNDYRRDNGFTPQIHWMNELEKTTMMEAKNIVDKSNFGQHSQFHKWKNVVLNKYFTELVVMLDTKGDGLPSEKVFALSVLFGLQTKEKYYLIHPYQSGAVSIAQNPKHKSQYIIVIHLVKQSGNYKSCLQAKKKGDVSKFINVKTKSGIKKVECSNEQGGGWTLIAKVNKKMDRVSTTEINDLGLSYTEIYFKSFPDHFMDLGKGANGQYLSKGYNFVHNCIKFGDTYYISQETAWGHGNVNLVKHAFYKMNTIKKIGQSTKCTFGGKSDLNYCSPSFIMPKQPTGRLNAISAIESFNHRGNSDDTFNYHFNMYVR